VDVELQLLGSLQTLQIQRASGSLVPVNILLAAAVVVARTAMELLGEMQALAVVLQVQLELQQQIMQPQTPAAAAVVQEFLV
jgi:hypothetical protein